MIVEIIPIGNSKGIRIPKSVFSQCGFEKTVDMEVVDHQLVIKAVELGRLGWAEAFSAENSIEEDDGLNELQAVSNVWDEEEWQW